MSTEQQRSLLTLLGYAPYCMYTVPKYNGPSCPPRNAPLTVGINTPLYLERHVCRRIPRERLAPVYQQNVQHLVAQRVRQPACG